MEKVDLLKEYGKYTFNKKRMKEILPLNIYKEYERCLNSNEELDKKYIKIIAESMMKWALTQEATHYTHWFSSLYGLSAEKHDAFIEPEGIDVTYKFNEDILLKSESDASSFPSGGLRTTYKAKGYTIWDYSSFSFVKDNSLYIPSLFYSSKGEALDYKSHLLKSNELLNKAGKRLLELLGKRVNKVESYVGVEQEYFLISKELFERRLDLKMCGRTLFGSSLKEQEDADHYFSPISQKVSDFMKELDLELWRYGIPSKTKHNEAAYNQFEVVCVYRKVNTTSDNNLLLMQVLKEIANKHGLVCLLNEVPFKGFNGSGKHNNFSLITDAGENLFSMGDDPLNNIPFLAILSCLIKGIDEYSDLLKISISSYSNDLRLGGNEAPPSTISISLGNKLNKTINNLLHEKEEKINEEDNDRNRTSPFAFLNNRFEFRGVGSSQSIAFVNTLLNCIIAKEFTNMVKELEKGKDVKEVIKHYLKKHKRIIYEGDNYSSSWKNEIIKRKLNNTKSCLDCFEVLLDKKKTKMLLEENVFTSVELESLFQILVDKYNKTIKLEAKTMIKMIKTEIEPIIIEYINELTIVLNDLKNGGINNLLLFKKRNDILDKYNQIISYLNLLEERLKSINLEKLTLLEKARKYQNEVISIMDKLREIVDNIEESIDKKKWPIPTYIDLLFTL